MCGSFLGGVAQTVEQVNHNHSVGGSSPSAATISLKSLSGSIFRSSQSSSTYDQHRVTKTPVFVFERSLRKRMVFLAF